MRIDSHNMYLMCTTSLMFNMLTKQCDNKATKKRNILAHIKSIHEGFKLSCQQCNYKATEKGNLLKHIKSKHKGVKFSCDQCVYKSSRKDRLLIHFKTVHEGVKKKKESFYSTNNAMSSSKNCWGLLLSWQIAVTGWVFCWLGYVYTLKVKTVATQT